MAASRIDTADRVVVAIQVVIALTILGVLTAGVFLLDSVVHMTEESVVLSDIHRDAVGIVEAVEAAADSPADSGQFISELTRLAGVMREGSAALDAFGGDDSIKAMEIDRHLSTVMTSSINLLAASESPAVILDAASAARSLEELAHDYWLDEAAELDESSALVNLARRVLMILGPASVLFGFWAVSSVSRLRTRADRVEMAESLVRSKDDFLAKVSHEIRTPLAGILGLSEVLRDQDLSHAESSELLATIAAQSVELSLLVEDLLTASRTDLDELSIASTEVDVQASVAHAVASFPEDVAISNAVGVRALGDPARVRQVLRNLISNAFRHGGGDVAVAVRGGQELVEIVVSDAGHEIPKEVADAMFDPYVTRSGESNPVGVGIGLTISRELARRMGGELAYRHENGRSEFVLALRAAVEAVPHAA